MFYPAISDSLGRGRYLQTRLFPTQIKHGSEWMDQWRGRKGGGFILFFPAIFTNSRPPLKLTVQIHLSCNFLLETKLSVGAVISSERSVSPLFSKCMFGYPPSCVRVFVYILRPIPNVGNVITSCRLKQNIPVLKPSPPNQKSWMSSRVSCFGEDI